MNRRTVLRGIATASIATVGVAAPATARRESVDEFDVLHVGVGGEAATTIENPTEADLARVGAEDCETVRCQEDCPQGKCCAWICRCYGDGECG